MQGFVIGIVVTYFFLKVSIPFLLVLAPDKPNKRSSHNTITPGSGGISFVFTTLLLALIQGEFQWFLCLPIAVVGLIDDRIKLSASIRYLAQLLTVYLIINNTIYQDYQIVGFADYLNIAFLLFFGTAIINFVNFMDGVDGLVAGCFFIITLFASIYSQSFLIVLAASLLAFLFFNWQPAKVFMGDVGSTYLGSFFVMLVYGQNNIQEAIRYLLLASPIFLDAASTILIRYRLNQNIFKAHKSHLFQRLYDAGWSHSKISLIYIFFTLLTTFSVIINNYPIIFITIFLTIISGIFLDHKYATPFEKSI